ncbi:MAG: hypothetical protein E3J90_06580 [Promethearchaeota archaeon]|nr:MAG: hypothetical protein E3J90_06580 [Candidatus Lokiarchaeota archaeon]
MERSDIYRKIMRFLTIFGGVIGFLYVFLRLYNIENVNEWIQNIGLGNVIFINCGLLIAGFTIITALKPNNPIPWHWITLITLAALTTIFIHLLPAILILIAGIFELIKEL